MANRQTRRKEKDYGRKISVDTSDESMSNLIKIGGVVAIVFIAFYILTLNFTGSFKNNNITDNNTTNTPVNIQYNEILAGETFNIKNAEYYVLFYDFSDQSANSLYNSIISDFKTNHTDAIIYKVDLSKGFSSSYVADVSNPSAQTIEDLKVKGPTAIKISNGQNVAFAEGKDAIKDIFK